MSPGRLEGRIGARLKPEGPRSDEENAREMTAGRIRLNELSLTRP